jgi:signal transduction histidine kinase
MNNSDDLTGILSFTLFTVLVFLFAVALAVRYRKRKKDNDRLRTTFEMELQKIKHEIHEQTLQHVSRELHDNLGLTASLVKINLNTVDSEGLSDSTVEKISSAKDLLRTLIKDIKNLSLRLGSNRISQHGFFHAIQAEIEQLDKVGIFAVSASFDIEADEPVGEKALILFRMVQEALNNAIKHSQATELNIKLTTEATSSVLSISDNGVGFDLQSTISKGQGAGLLNLFYRAQLIGADIDFQSQNFKGTIIKIRFQT